jgi:hypothetical protein
MLEYGAKAEDPVVSFDGRQSEVAAELQRGVCRAFRALGHCVFEDDANFIPDSCVGDGVDGSVTERARSHALDQLQMYELTLPNGRRDDVVAMSASCDVLIVEIKSCLLDYRTDAKWQEYPDYCDRLYFAVRADFPCEVIPEGAGLILADRYGAELVWEGIEERLPAARRKAMMLAFARAAALRLQQHLDPGCIFEM